MKPAIASLQIADDLLLPWRIKFVVSDISSCKGLHYTERLGCMELGLMILLNPQLVSKMCHLRMETELVRMETELFSTVWRFRQATSF